MGDRLTEPLDDLALRGPLITLVRASPVSLRTSMRLRRTCLSAGNTYAQPYMPWNDMFDFVGAGCLRRKHSASSGKVLPKENQTQYLPHMIMLFGSPHGERSR